LNKYKEFLWLEWVRLYPIIVSLEGLEGEILREQVLFFKEHLEGTIRDAYLLGKKEERIKLKKELLCKK
jgi:hypothetical protein